MSSKLAGVAGSATVHARLQDYYRARGEFVGSVAWGAEGQEAAKEIREARTRAA
jgi:hypothetical protein